MSRAPFDVLGPIETGVTLLEASAGTGKTWSIASLVLRLVAEHGFELPRLLVVTFTEAATAELRERVRKRLREGLTVVETGEAAGDPVMVHLLTVAGAQPEAVRRRLVLALEAFDEAAIFTIHGFCARVLHQNAFESGADFETELVGDVSDLVTEIVADFWTRESWAAPEARIRLLMGHGVHLAALTALAKAVVGRRDAPVQPKAPAGPEPELLLDVWQRASDTLASSWREARPALAEMLHDGIVNKHLDARSWKADKLDGWLAEVDAWAAGDRRPGQKLPEGLTRLCQASVTKGLKKKAPPIQHEVMGLLDALCEEAGRLESLAADLALRTTHRFVTEVRSELARRKRERLLQSFDDLLHLVRDALVGDPDGTGALLATAIRGQYDAALIDEFQDTDPVQWATFERVFGGGAGAPGGARLFLIGDPKQAIYAFRGGDVFTYLAAQRVADRERGMGRNFRSDEPLVRAVNHLFGRPTLAAPFVTPRITFDRVAARHVVPRLRGPGSDPRLRVCFLPREGRSSGKSLPSPWAGRVLPLLVASDVVETLGSGLEVHEGEVWRPVQPRDCAVLVRTNAQALEMQEALRRAGLPSVLYTDEDVLATREGTELLHVLAAVLEPTRTRLLRTALATDLLGVTASELLALESDPHAFEGWVERFRGWSACWQAQGFIQAFRRLVSETAVAERLLGCPDGERRFTNLLHLGEVLQTAAHDEGLGPAALLAWARTARDEERGATDERRLVRLESDAEAVQILTVHRSKGLQFRLVWCPYLWWSRSSVGRGSNLTFHDDARGEETVIQLKPTLDAKGDPEWQRACEAKREEELAEQMRVAYVALTRAELRCTVYWGAFSSAAASPLAHLLHRGVSGPEDFEVKCRRVADAGDAALLADLRQLAADSDGTLGVEVIDDDPVGFPTWNATQATPADPIARSFRRDLARDPLDPAWRRASFTQMLRSGDDAHGHVPDHDAQPEGPAPAVGLLQPSPADPGPRIPLADFARGARAGTFLHSVLELHDFTRPEALALQVGRGLVTHGLDARWSDRLGSALQQVLDTPLDLPPRAFTLADLPRSARLDELDFDLPLSGGLDATGLDPAVTCQAMAALFAAHPSPSVPADYPDRLRALGFPPVRGFLTGSIDLAFVREGRWYVVDYKSNHLGDFAGDYGEAHLRRAMSDAHYILQYHLYVVALHRYLAWRLPGYDYDRDFGEVLYLFLRGMDPARGPATGVFRDRPSRALVLGLDRLFQGGDR